MITADALGAAGFGLAFAALIAAAAALVLSLILMRQNGDTTEDLREHRRAHRAAYGHPDPRLDRRQRNLPPPASTGERRGQHPVDVPVDAHMPRLTHVDEPIEPQTLADPELAAHEHARRDRVEHEPGPVEPPATTQLERQDLPTSQIPIVDRTRPQP